MGLLDIFRVSKIKQENEELKRNLKELGYEEYSQVQAFVAMATAEIKERQQAADAEIKAKRQAVDNEITQKKMDAEKQADSLQTKLLELNSDILRQKESLDIVLDECDKKKKQLLSVHKKVEKVKELYNSIEYCRANFLKYMPDDVGCILKRFELEELNELSPSVILKLHCMDIRDLQKAYRENDKQISKLLEQYAVRYTTKANQAIYKLMVVALRAELQNILVNLKYEKLDTAIESVKQMTEKYLHMAGDGNQSIAGTLVKFIGEVEYLFINAVKIEYNYYVKKEQARQEQLAIREQMRQEAEERKALEAERKKVEAEEAKYTQEIEKLSVQLIDASDDEKTNLTQRMLDLQDQLSNVVIEKEKIMHLANGRAGNVYIISNLGSFGESVFKIGMTRRIDPQQRVDELGDASVPFRFDVHSFIFSNDAVGLESKIHTILNNKRVNKVNLRREFFYTSLDELEAIVASIDPTAEFNKTMLAEEFRQSQSTNEVYSSDFVYENTDDTED